MRSGLWVLRALLCTVAFQLGGPVAADSGLPEFTIGLPEAEAPQAAFDLKFDLARRLLAAESAVSDPPSVGAIGPATARLAAVLATADAEATSVMGAFSRGMAEYLAATLYVRRKAGGWQTMRDAAVLAIAMERQHSANAVFLGSFFPDTAMAAALGVKTDALQDVLFHLAHEAETERLSGAASPTRSEALAFWLAQAAFTGDTAMAALGSQRSNPALDTAEVYQDVTDLRDLMAEVAFLNQLIEEGFAFPDPEATFASLVEGTDRVGVGLQELQSRGVDLADALFPWMVSLDRLKGAIRQDEAVLMIVPSGVDALLFAVTQDGFMMRRSGLNIIEVMDQADRIRAAIGWVADRGALPLKSAPVKPTEADTLQHEAFQAYRALLQPVEALIRDKRRLLVVSTADTGLGIPFELMLTAPAPPGAADKDLPWLVRRHAVTHVPALDLLWLRDQLLPTTPSASGEVWYLGFGAPDYALPSQLGRSNWATRLIATLRPLPDAAEEVQAVAAALGAGQGVFVTGKDASEALLEGLNDQGALRTQTVIHFATHGLVYGDHPDVGEPFLALTPMLDIAELPGFEIGTINAPRPDGALLASEIRQLDLAARLVILSACSSARVDGDKNGLTSLASAFLYAGAGQVLGTHWPIQSEAAVEIVTGMSRRDPRFDDPAIALQQTLLAVIAEGGRKADPAYWAAFSLVGTP